MASLASPPLPAAPPPPDRLFGLDDRWLTVVTTVATLGTFAIALCTFVCCQQRRQAAPLPQIVLAPDL
jgi:hypothetical protein